MSRIYPHGFSPCKPDSGRDLCSQETTSNSPTQKAMSLNADGSAGSLPCTDTNLWDRNQWDMHRLMALDRSKNWQEQWNPRMSMSFNNTKGLLNAPGDNNCFLNSAVQVLWHLDVFRRSFRMLSGHSCLGSNSCIFCALKVIFTQFQYSDQSCLPPDALRRALAKTFADQQRFQLGLMDDAAECFENILTQIHFHIANGESEDMCNAKHCISHQKFAMTVIEQVVCPCEATSEPLPFSQMVHYVSTSTLVSQAKIANSAATFGQLLKRAISEGDYRNCPSNCGRKVQLRRTLLNSPDVVSVGLVWDSENPSSQHIHDVVWSIGTTLQLKDLFHDVVDIKCKQGSKLHLVGVVCYYGKHYSTFFYHSKMKSWVSFDDANVKEMGSDWSAIVDKCCRGHYQPLLLLYANPDAEVINVETAPQRTVIVKETAFLSNSEENSSGPTGSYHCRQRSCDSLSGTIGGQCVDDSYTDSIRMKRSVTPNPDSGKEKIQALPRRAITPGPEWGRYDSDDDSHTPEIVHQRQSSYLNALESVDATERQRSASEKIPSYRHHDVKDVNHASGIYRGYQHGDDQNDSARQFASDSQSQACDVAAYGSVCSESAIASVARSTTMYQVAASHNGTDTHYSSPFHGASCSNGQQSVSVTRDSCHPDSQPSLPSSCYSKNQQIIPASHISNRKHPIPAGHHSNSQLPVPVTHFPNGQQGNPTSYYSNIQQPVPRSHASNGPQPVISHPASHPAHYPNCQQSILKPHYSDGQPPISTSHYSSGQRSIPVGPCSNSQQSLSMSHYSNGQLCVPASQHPSGQVVAPASCYSNGQQPALSTHYSDGGQSASLSHRAYYSSGSQAVLLSHSTNGKQPIPLSATCHKQPQSAPSTPGMKRAQSVENSDSLLAHGPAARPTVSQSRPSSARPYDYGNPRPCVDPNTGAVILPNRQQPVVPGLPGSGSEWNEAVLIGDFTTPDSCELKPASTKKKPFSGVNRWDSDVGDDVDDGYGTYINPKTVQNVLNIQKSRNTKLGANISIKTVPVSGTSHVPSESHNHKDHALLADLKVDIPGDNISLGSHKDSGYRSGGSSGDRNSASSASSISFDSPTAENFRGFAGIHRPLMNSHNLSAHSSSESLSSTQSGQTIKNIQNNRLSLIPENNLSSSSSSLTVSGSKSQESLNSSQDYVDGFTSDKTLNHSKMSDRWDCHVQKVNDTSSCAGADVNHEPDGECQKLFLQAEAMLDLSSKQEESGDLNTALAYCNQAINCLQKAFSIPGITNDTSVHVRMKHNACILRSRKLHKQIIKQQHPDLPNKSTESKVNLYQSKTSVSRSSSCEGFLTSNGTKQSAVTMSGKDQTAAQERKVASCQPQLESFNSQSVGYNNDSNLIGPHKIAVSGIAQSRPVQGVTMGHANIPQAALDSAVSQQSQCHNRDTHQQCPSQTQDISKTIMVNRDNLDAKDARYVDIYGTLPKRKGKKSNSPQNTTGGDHRPQDGKHCEDFGGDDCSQGLDTMPPESETVNHSRMALINHSRQWSKDELRDILLKDFMNRPKASSSQTKNTKPGIALQRRNSYDPLDNSNSSVSVSISQSEQNSYEALLSKQMTTVSTTDHYPDLPPKQKNTNQKHFPVQSASQEESHYDYLPLRTKPSHSGSSGMSPSEVTSVNNYKLSSASRPSCATSRMSSSSGMPSSSLVSSACGKPASSGMPSTPKMSCGSGISSVNGFSESCAGMTIVGITGIPHHKLSYMSPQFSDRQSNQNPQWKSEFSDPYSSKRELPSVPKETTNENEQKCFYSKTSAVKSIDKTKNPHYVKTFEIQRPGEQGRAAVVETVPIKVNKPDTPPKPTRISGKSVKPDVPKRKSSQLSTFKGDTTVASNPLHTNRPLNPTSDNRASMAPPPYLPPPPSTQSTAAPEPDLPPPPAELLYPPLEEQHQPQMNNCYDDGFEKHTHFEASGQTSDEHVDAIQLGRTPPVPCQTPTKPALSKAKGMMKPRKSVTFNENIALIATPEEVPQEIDYVAYVMNLGKKKCLKQNSENKTNMSVHDGGGDDDYKDDDDDEEDDDNTSDSMDSDAVLCNLCRKKKIHLPEIYCEHCCFYMSQFQPQAS